MIHIILLSGGSGTRLWPLSNGARSKQFLKVLRDEQGKPISMVQRVVGQLSRIPAEIDVTVAAGAAQQESIRLQMPPGYALVLEPERRDTAPAIMLACAHLASVQKAGLGDTVIVMPTDTFADQDYFGKVCDLDAAVQEDSADLILLGAEPASPSEEYGYIVPETRAGAVWPVASFREKPGRAAARALIEQGSLWNCGVFAFRLGYLVDITARQGMPVDFDALCERYGDLPRLSFDYEVVEKAASVAVVPYTGRWKDLGTWNTLSEEMSETCVGRAVVDEETCENVHVINETGLPLAVAGLKDSVVVASSDGILVSGKKASANMKRLVACAEETRPMYEQRRWGEYRVLDSSVYPNGRKALTKELWVWPGKQLSYQRHQSRSEVWTVVSGSGEVVTDGNRRAIGPGSVVCIEPGTLHAVRALEDLHIVEVQMGDILAEEDIERFDDFWE